MQIITKYKSCLECGKEYIPTGRNQKWCADCKPSMTQRQRRKCYQLSPQRQPQRELLGAAQAVINLHPDTDGRIDVNVPAFTRLVEAVGAVEEAWHKLMRRQR